MAVLDVNITCQANCFKVCLFIDAYWEGLLINLSLPVLMLGELMVLAKPQTLVSLVKWGVLWLCVV